MQKPKQSIVWTEVSWARPFEPKAALELLTHLATMNRFSHLVFEIRAHRGKVHYLIGASEKCLADVKRLIHGQLAGVRFHKAVNRKPVAVVRNIRASHPSLALNTNNELAIIRALLASLVHGNSKDDEIALQVVLGRSFTPSLLPNKLSDPTSSWLDMLRGTVAPASSETRNSMREKANCHGFAAVIRIGTTCQSLPQAARRIRDVLSGLRVAESMGVRLYVARGNSSEV